MPGITDEQVKRAANCMRDECGSWFEKRPEAGLFDWHVAAHNALRAARIDDEAIAARTRRELLAEIDAFLNLEPLVWAAEARRRIAASFDETGLRPMTRPEYRDTLHSVRVSDMYLGAPQFAQLREAAEPFTLSPHPRNLGWTCDTPDAASAERLCALLRGWEIPHTLTTGWTWQS